MEKVEVNLWKEKTGDTQRKIYPDSVSSTTKPAWSDQTCKFGTPASNSLHHGVAFVSLLYRFTTQERLLCINNPENIF